LKKKYYSKKSQELSEWKAWYLITAVEPANNKKTTRHKPKVNMAEKLVDVIEKLSNIRDIFLIFKLQRVN